MRSVPSFGLPFVVATLLALAGCGGGSSNDSPAAASPPPAPPPPLPTPSPAKQQAYRFLNQATFGATEAEAQRLLALSSGPDSYSLWVDAQLAVPPSLQLPSV